MIKRLVITGYKQYELGIFDDKSPAIPIIKKALRRALIPLIEDGLEWVLLSGQLGVETWAAEVIMDLREDYPDLKYAIITPFLDQEKGWKAEKVEKYEEILLMADFHATVSKRPYEGPWQFTAKNQFLIRNSDGLLLLYDEEKEGTPKYIKEMAEKYKEKTDYTIITISFHDLETIYEEEQWKDW
mgnify:CR=1 FL=1